MPLIENLINYDFHAASDENKSSSIALDAHCDLFTLKSIFFSKLSQLYWHWNWRNEPINANPEKCDEKYRNWIIASLKWLMDAVSIAILYTTIDNEPNLMLLSFVRISFENHTQTLVIEVINIKITLKVTNHFWWLYYPI